MIIHAIEFDEKGYQKRLLIRALKMFEKKTALKLYKNNPKDAIVFITNHSYSKAIKALEIADDMTGKLHTTIARYTGF